MRWCLLWAIALLVSLAASADDNWRNDVLYFVMLDRFADGDISNNDDVDLESALAFHGGDLKGLRDNLDEIRALGATAIWLTPITKQVGPITSELGLFYGHHGYWADNFTEIDPRFGTEADLKDLVDRAHEMDMRIILDVVYNHVGYDSDWTRTRPEWLRLDDECGGNAETLCLSGLPDIRTELPKVREYLFDAHIGLAERTGIDGFRLDTVKHISHDFWQEHQAAVRNRLGPEFLLLGEVWGADKYLAEPYFQRNELDAITDFGFRDRTLKFLTGVTTANRYSRYLSKRHTVPEGKLLAHFLSNHDMPMLLAMLRGDKEKLKVAATILLTTEGLPVITWGETVGRRGGIWPANRQDMPWGERDVQPGTGIERDTDLRAIFQQLIGLRRDYSAFSEEEISIVSANDRTFAFSRGSDFIVAVNGSSSSWTFDLPDADKRTWISIFATSENTQMNTLAPNSAAIFKRQG